MIAKKLSWCCGVAAILLTAFPRPALGQLGRDFRILDLERELTLFSASIGSGARALSMGGAFIAIADDGTAASWNPAGLGVLEEPELSINWQPVYSETVSKSATRFVANPPPTENGLFFADTGSTQLTRTSQSLDFLSLAVPIRIAGRKIVPQFSFQSVVPSLDAEFEGSPSEAITSCGADCRQRRLTEGSAFSTSQGGIDVYAASIGIPLKENLRVGVSFNWWRGSTTTRIDDTSTELTSGADTPGRDAEETEIRNFSTSELSESMSGFNANVGVIVELTRWAHVGAVFKSPYGTRRVEEGTSSTSLLLRSLRDPSALAYQSAFFDVRVESEGEINWPATLGLGFAWFPASAVTVSTDFTWSNWSDTRYDEEVTIRTSLGTESTTRRNNSFPAEAQVDAWQYRLGAELVVVNPSFAKLLAVPLRGGFFLDRQYFLDFRGNTVLSRGVSAGVGLVWSKVTLDFAYMYESAPREPAARVEEIAEGITDSGAQRSLEGFRQEPGEGKFSRHQVLVTTIIRF